MSLPLSIIKQEDYTSNPLLARLLELHDIPKQIYIKGELPKITIDEYGRATPRILTVIGSRKYTNYGKNALEKLINSLAGEDIIILSGLAYGIDILSHNSALKNNLITIAVPGSGLDEKSIYPKSHLNIAKEIIDSGGALLSELSPETGPAQWTFPSRNRIMAALSDAVLVVEAEMKSGTLITARQALELGRDIGAVPGDIFSPTSIGTNSLISDGAYIVANEDDLYSLLHLSKNETKKVAEIFNDEEKIIMDILLEPTEKDTLLIKSNLPLEKFLSAFSSLEISGQIEETFGEVRRLV
ncbi:DNA-processing protein DprA [Candidatus Gracilibacteria bacterium]|nr:DNA-processing protein DprA [Candidatus Gracilibacteria bacterium]MCF7898497.1 DNA-processing protein DprA [Candidatus Paceibacterota bacterium]